MRPNLNVVLIDLRCHGRSRLREFLLTLLMRAQEDLFKLSGAVGTPDVVIGHSFGGKVALAALLIFKSSAALGVGSPPGPLSDRPEDRHEVSNVISALSAVPIPLKKRSDLKHVLVSSGFSEAIGKWMTTNWRKQMKDTSGDLI